jgi:hypothetical protein
MRARWEVSNLVIFTEYYYIEEIKKDVVGEANSTIRKNEECTQNFDGKT